MKIYLISGKARSGKDTVAKIMKEIFEEKGLKVCFCPIAKSLKQYFIDYFGWDGNDEAKPRDEINYLGTEIIRKKLNHPEFFVDRTLQDIEILNEFFDVLIVPDIRFEIEIEKIKSQYKEATLIRVNRPNFISDLTEKQKNDDVEIALDDYQGYDYYIENTEKENLKEKVREILIKNGDID